jgi:hypothetical protein
MQSVSHPFGAKLKCTSAVPTSRHTKSHNIVNMCIHGSFRDTLILWSYYFAYFVIAAQPVWRILTRLIVAWLGFDSRQGQKSALRYRVQTSSGASYPLFCIMNTRWSFQWVKGGRGGGLTTHLHLVRRWRTRVTPLPYTSSTWQLYPCVNILGNSSTCTAWQQEVLIWRFSFRKVQ